VKRYIESAKIEAEIIEQIMKSDRNNQSHCVQMIEYFSFQEDDQEYIVLVFEKLGKSLYDFIKFNNYRGKFKDFQFLLFINNF
jgi:hypothetical protein